VRTISEYIIIVAYLVVNANIFACIDTFDIPIPYTVPIVNAYPQTK
jgi:hypothetical protein